MRRLRETGPPTNSGAGRTGVWIACLPMEARIVELWKPGAGKAKFWCRPAPGRERNWTRRLSDCGDGIPCFLYSWWAPAVTPLDPSSYRLDERCHQVKNGELGCVGLSITATRKAVSAGEGPCRRVTSDVPGLAAVWHAYLATRSRLLKLPIALSYHLVMGDSASSTNQARDLHHIPGSDHRWPLTTADTAQPEGLHLDHQYNRHRWSRLHGRRDRSGFCHRRSPGDPR